MALNIPDLGLNTMMLLAGSRDGVARWRSGDNVQIMDDAHLSGGTEVGSGSFIGQNACTANDDHPLGYVLTELKPVIIGKGCLIGHNATLRAGIRIGDGATIGSGALVVKDVPPGAVVLSQPARVRLAAKVRK